MVKKLLLSCLIAFILGGAVAYYVFQDSTHTYDEKVLKEYGLEPLPCSLNKTECKVNYEDSKVTFDINPKPISFMKKTSIRISGLKISSPDLKFHIYGLNMDMGILIADLKQQDGGYVSEVALSSCLLRTMRYRISVYEGITPLGLSIDFDLEN